MSEEDLMSQFVDAYNKHTGQKLPQPVPESYFNLFPDTLAKTPTAKAAESKNAAKSTTKQEN